jgi:glutaredoxin 3
MENIMNVVIYTKENCSYCSRAKMLLVSKNIPYTELKLNENFTRENLLELFPSAKTFPVIVVDGFNIGGYSQLNEMLANKESDTRKLLNE